MDARDTPTGLRTSRHAMTNYNVTNSHLLKLFGLGEVTYMVDDPDSVTQSTLWS